MNKHGRVGMEEEEKEKEEVTEEQEEEKWGTGRYGKLLSGGAHENRAEETSSRAIINFVRNPKRDSSFHAVTKSACPCPHDTSRLSTLDRYPSRPLRSCR